jgi:hypothetical protein
MTAVPFYISAGLLVANLTSVAVKSREIVANNKTIKEKNSEDHERRRVALKRKKRAEEILKISVFGGIFSVIVFVACLTGSATFAWAVLLTPFALLAILGGLIIAKEGGYIN